VLTEARHRRLYSSAGTGPLPEWSATFARHQFPPAIIRHAWRRFRRSGSQSDIPWQNSRRTALAAAVCLAFNANSVAKNAETAPARVDFLVERRGFGDSTVALLEDLGYSVLAGRNGVEALAQLRKSARIDILFTDVVLP
jgi:hypothetical protein